MPLVTVRLSNAASRCLASSNKRTMKTSRLLIPTALLGLVALLPACSENGHAAELGQTAAASDPHAGHDHGDHGSVLEHYDPASPAASMAAIQAGDSGSDLKFEYLAFDLGKVYQHHDYDLEFPFTVEGPDPVVITELDSTCGCTSVKIRPDWDPDFEGEYWPLNRPIPAGAKGAVVAKFESGRYKDDKPTSVTVRGNFLSRKIVLSVTAFVQPVFALDMVVLQFGEVLSGALRDADPKQTIKVVAMKEFEVVRWKRVPPGVLVSRQEGSKVMEDGRVETYFDIIAGPDMPIGRMSSSVIAETSIGVDLEFLVNADVVGAVKYAPATRVAFGIFDQGKARKRTVKVQSTRTGLKLPVPQFEVAGDAAKVVQAELVTVEDQQHYEIKLTIGAEAPAGSYNGVLRISYPEGSGLAEKEVVLNARIRQPR